MSCSFFVCIAWSKLVVSEVLLSKSICLLLSPRPVFDHPPPALTFITPSAIVRAPVIDENTFICYQISHQPTRFQS